MRSKKSLVLVAMVFAVGMTFIDQTIVAIAIPNIQRELNLTATGAHWVINGYLLALSALFALGGKLGDARGPLCLVARSAPWGSSSWPGS